MKRSRFITTILSMLLCIIGCDSSQQPDSTTAIFIYEGNVDLTPHVGSEGGEFTIAFTTNVAWHTEVEHGWVTVTPPSGTRDCGAFTINVAKNDTPEKRVCSVTIYYGDLSSVLIVTQEAGVLFEIEGDAQRVVGVEGGEVTMMVTTNIEYDIVIKGEEWISLSDTRTLRNEELCFLVAENNTTEPRSGDILFVDLNGHTLSQVSIAQDTHPLSIIEVDDIEVDMNGGNYEVRYKISNPKEDAMVVCEASETWVNVYDIDFELVKFEVEANNGPKRECCVTMKYPYAEDRSFIIYQGGKTTEGFEFENITYSYDSLTLDIIPDNKEMPYIIRCYAPEEVYDYGLITGDDFYGYDIENIDMLQYVKYGNQCGVTFSNLVSRTPYTICCYYIDCETFRLLSDVDIFTITTDGPSLMLVDFMAEYSFENANLSVDVMPVNYSGDYYFDIVNVTEIDGLMVRYPHFITNIEEAIEYWWAYKVCGYKLYMTIDEIIKHYSCNGVNDDGRPKSHREFDVEEHAEYYLVAYALDENALCRSFPVYVIIKNNGAQH